MRTRHGFTRLDAVAILAILVLLGGMMMPALATNAQRSNKTNTVNNLKQIGLAFQTHNDQEGYIPNNGGANDEKNLAAVNYGWHNPKVRHSGTWATQIAPFLEQNAFFTNNKAAAKDIVTFPDYTENSWKVSLKIYLDPERDRVGFKTSKEKGCYPGPVTDFAINCFLHAQPTQYSKEGYGRGEMKPWANGDWAAANSKITVGTIPDGSSNTIMVGEKSLPPALAKMNVSYSNAPVPKDAEANANGGDEGIFSPGNWGFKDGKKFLVSTGTARGHTVVKDPPKETPKENPKDGGVPWMYLDSELTGDPLPPYQMAWGSPFKEGVPFMFGDGTVRFVKYTQKGTVNFARMLYPADGQVVTFDD